jgi:ribosomal protein S18 acetylase RimI-like enzyme
MELEILKTEKIHSPELYHLYRKVARISGGIIRHEKEITDDYITYIIRTNAAKGLSLVGTINGKVVAEIHACTLDIFAFRHILSDLTIVVDPDHQCKGIGRRLFECFLKKVTEEMPHIKRIELFTREHSQRTVKFYESLGFKNEGRQQDKIFVSGSEFETPIHMAWFNPGYKHDSPPDDSTIKDNP